MKKEFDGSEQRPSSVAVCLVRQRKVINAVGILRGHILKYYFVVSVFSGKQLWCFFSIATYHVPR